MCGFRAIQHLTCVRVLQYFADESEFICTYNVVDLTDPDRSISRDRPSQFVSLSCCMSAPAPDRLTSDLTSPILLIPAYSKREGNELQALQSTIPGCRHTHNRQQDNRIQFNPTDWNLITTIICNLTDPSTDNTTFLIHTAQQTPI
jgi:hypothetical protein